MKNWCKRASDLFFCGIFLTCLTASAFGQNMFQRINDFDGDRKADLAITRNIGGYKYWYIRQSRDGFKVFQWGLASDLNAAADYEDDARTDIAVFRQEPAANGMSQYTFWIYGSLFGFRRDDTIAAPYANAAPHQQDYDGDYRADIAFTTGNSSLFFIKYSTGIQSVFANMTGIPVKIGDITGDNKSEIAAYDPSDQRINYRITPNATVGTRFGDPGDIFVPADFDGDYKGEYAIFRPSTGAWWWLRTSNNTVNSEAFGVSGDIPVPADYDGDGKTDIAIWRKGQQSDQQSYYWIKGSQAGVYVVAWGVGGDSVVTY